MREISIWAITLANLWSLSQKGSQQAQRSETELVVTDFCGRLVHSPHTSFQEVDLQISNVVFPKGKRHDTICFLYIYFTVKFLLKRCADIILKF